MFLMYRVELKGQFPKNQSGSQRGFLMYRVELKANIENAVLILTLPVPNVPCGVESRQKGNKNLVLLTSS